MSRIAAVELRAADQLEPLLDRSGRPDHLATELAEPALHQHGNQRFIVHDENTRHASNPQKRLARGSRIVASLSRRCKPASSIFSLGSDPGNELVPTRALKADRLIRTPGHHPDGLPFGARRGTRRGDRAGPSQRCRPEVVHAFEVQRIGPEPADRRRDAETDQRGFLLTANARLSRSPSAAPSGRSPATVRPAPHQLTATTLCNDAGNELGKPRSRRNSTR